MRIGALGCDIAALTGVACIATGIATLLISDWLLWTLPQEISHSTTKTRPSLSRYGSLSFAFSNFNSLVSNVIWVSVLGKGWNEHSHFRNDRMGIIWIRVDECPICFCELNQLRAQASSFKLRCWALNPPILSSVMLCISLIPGYWSMEN